MHVPRLLAPCLLALPLGAVLSTGCSKAPTQGKPGRGILIVAVDGWRWDHLSQAGYDRNTSSHLESLASDFVIFENTWSTGADLIPAHMALMTGCDPTLVEAPVIPLADGTIAAPAFRWTIPDQVPRLAAQLFQEGWATAAFVDDPRLGALRGVDLGFHEVAQFGGGLQGEERMFGFSGVGVRFAKWLETVEAGQDWFAYVHVGDLDRMWQHGRLRMHQAFPPRPELDFVPPIGRAGPVFHAISPERRGDRQRTMGELEVIYDTALWSLDKHLERVYEHLAEHSDWERTTLAMVGTYGTCFGEGGLILDAGGLTEADLRVPLFLRPAPVHGFDVGHRSEALVSLIDLAPTMLTLAEAQVPKEMHGSSLVPVLGGLKTTAREHAFARSALLGGYAVIDSKSIYSAQWAEPRSTTILSRSFAGLLSGAILNEETVNYVETGRAVHQVPRVIDDAERRTNLRAIGDAWFRDVGDVRDLLHLGAWSGGPSDPARIAELRERGLLGKLP
jgi:arylsulfatase A-like enzyme